MCGASGKNIAKSRQLVSRKDTMIAAFYAFQKDVDKLHTVTPPKIQLGIDVKNAPICKMRLALVSTNNKSQHK